MTQTQQIMAAAYDANGQKTGQRTSWFSWWLATNDNGEVLDYPRVQQEARKTGKIRIIGESTMGRRINSVLETEHTPNGTVTAKIEGEDETGVFLYPSCQVTLNSCMLVDYWVNIAGQYIAYNEIEFDENEEFNLEQNSEDLIEIHGWLSNHKEATVNATGLIKLGGYSEGSLVAIGCGQRYILRRPTSEVTVLAYEAGKRAHA